MPSDTYQGYALLRSVLKSGSDADVAKAVAYAKRIKLYPLSQAANPPATTFVDASDVVFDSTIPYDLRFFESLNRDGAGRAVAGTRQGDDRPAQDHRHRAGQALQAGREDASRSSTSAIQEAKAWFDARYDTLPPFYEGERWFFPSTEEMHPERHERLADAGFLSDRRPRHRLYARLLQRQASGRVPILSADGQRQGRQAAGRQVLLSFESAGERAGHPILVDDRLQPRDARLHPECPVGRPLLADAGTAKERGRFGGHLLRPDGAGGQGIELGPDRPERPLRGARPLLRSAEAAVRQDVEAAGHREG